MPKYKLVLTVQDSYGMTKEIEAGTVEAADYELTDKDIKTLDKTFATDAEVAALIENRPGDSEPPTPENPEPENPPEEISNTLKSILANKSSIYSQNSSGDLIASEFVAVTWSVAEAAKAHTGESVFYMVENSSGDVVEYGYQEVTEQNEEDWLTIALPDNIAAVNIEMFDAEANKWTAVTFKIEPTGEYLGTSAIWKVPEKYEIPSGGTYRFIVVE